MKTKILDHQAILQKITRIAYQIIEENFEEKEVILIGVKPNGFSFAERLKSEIETFSKVKITLLSLTLNKQQPLSEEIVFDKGKTVLKDKVVLLVDDVASTGKTAFYALKPIMEEQPKKVQIAVLVDRKHKRFPVSADFVGLSLSTTLKEHITVEIKNKKAEAFLQ